MSVGDHTKAKIMARELITKNWVFCAQISPSTASSATERGVWSIYRWQGKICEEAEISITFKTTATHKDQVLEWILNHHPYEVPALWLREVTCASPGYLTWANAETSNISTENPSTP